MEVISDRGESIMKKNILFISNYPSPYRVEFFNQLGAVDEINLTVIFLENPSQQTHRSKDWFNTDYSFFQAVFLTKKISLGGKRVIHPELLSWVKKPFDEIIFGGYSYPSFMWAMEFLKRNKRPFSMEADGGLISEDSTIKYKIKSHFLSMPSKWYSSGRVTSEYLTHYGADASKIVTYPFSSLCQKDLMKKEDLAKKKEESRALLGFSSDQRIALNIGQFIHRKGVDVLLKAIAKVDPEILFLIVCGKPTEEYQEIIEKEKISNVKFLDFMPKDKLSYYYDAADFFVCPTREDIWGLVINEAMAHGLPTISTDRCGAGVELIEDGQSGFVVKTGDVDALAQAIQKISKMDLKAMGEKALKRVQGYTIEEMVKVHIRSFMS